MNHIEFTWTSQDGLKMYTQGWLPDADPKAVVCLVHGLGEHTGRYQYVAQALTTRGYALIGYDLRGHGKSQGQRGHSPSYEFMMDDIARFLQEISRRYPQSPIFLYGHSLGGNLVLNFVLRCHPQISGVISTSPGLATTNPAAPAWKLALGKIAYRLWPTLSMPNGLEREALSRNAAVIYAYSSDPLVHDKISARFGLDFIESGLYAIQHASEFDLPLLIEHGSADRICSPAATRQFAQNVPGDCTLKIWEGLYHETHNEPEKDIVIKTMTDWLDCHTTA